MKHFTILTSAVLSSSYLSQGMLFNPSEPKELFPGIQDLLPNEDGEPFIRSMRRAACRAIDVLLTSEDVAASIFFEGAVGPGIRQGGSIRLRNPKDINETVGVYSYLSTFLSNSTQPYQCIGTGSYVLGHADVITGEKDEITFTASCTNLPFLTLTGGQGRYLGATGYSKTMVPHAEGFVHEIYLCDKDI